MRSSGGSPKRRKPSTNSAPMMSACSMPSVNTGHGVRATQRTNALIRPIGTASVVTGQPYRSAADRK